MIRSFMKSVAPAYAMVAAIIIAMLACIVPQEAVRAQFADQATYAGTGGGSPNAQTITVVNTVTYSDVTGVLLKFIPGFSNTAAATLNVNSFGTSPAIRKLTPAGLTALSGGEIIAGLPIIVMYDGTYFDIMVLPSQWTQTDPRT